MSHLESMFAKVPPEKRRLIEQAAQIPESNVLPPGIDLDRLARQVAYVARTTACSVCNHPLNRHWLDSVTIEDGNGNRRYCVVAGCTCIPSWAVTHDGR